MTERHNPDAATFPLRTFLGMELETREGGVGVARATVDSDCLNPNGVVHGGVVFTLIDTAMGAATMSMLAPDKACASIDVTVRFLRPVTSGTLFAHATVLRPGRRVMQLQARVTVDGELIATGDGAFAVFDK